MSHYPHTHVSVYMVGITILVPIGSYKAGTALYLQSKCQMDHSTRKAGTPHGATRARARRMHADDDLQRHAAFRNRCEGGYDESFSSDKVSKLFEASYAQCFKVNVTKNV